MIKKYCTLFSLTSSFGYWIDELTINVLNIKSINYLLGLSLTFRFTHFRIGNEHLLMNTHSFGGITLTLLSLLVDKMHRFLIPTASSNR